ncbi:MAG: hypothetical protein ABIP75_06690, partial [Pyrinomonadaceae bacterium]
IQSPLLDSRAKGTTVQLLGTERVDGVDHFKLKLNFRTGHVVTYFISSKTYLLTKSTEERNVDGQAVEIETTYSNYKKNADGYLFPYTTYTVIGEAQSSVTNYDKIETNVAVDPVIFTAQSLK